MPQVLRSQSGRRVTVTLVVVALVLVVLILAIVRGVGAGVSVRGPSGGCSHIELVNGHPAHRCS